MSLAKAKKPELVVILPYTKDKVLMQLRDVKDGITFPGQWGFFGGAILDGETSDEAVRRELFEEIGYKPKSIHKFSINKIPELGNIISHSYCCPLTKSVESIELVEGIDTGLFSLEEVMTGRLYSSKMKKTFSVIGIPHIKNTIRALIGYIQTNKKTKNIYE